MAMNTQNWETWKPEIDGFIQDEVDATPETVMSRLSTETSTDRLQVSEVTYSGFVPAHAVAESEEAVENSMLEGFRTNFIRQNYRDAAVYSKNLLDTDLEGTMKSRVQDFTRMTVQTRELNFMGIFRNGWTNSGLYSWSDGKSLVSTAHPRKDGGTAQYNTFTDGVQLPLSYTAVNNLRNVLTSSNVSNTGNILNLGDAGNDLVLLVGPSLQEAAFQIAGVETGNERPDTANRATNFFKVGTRMNVMVSHYLSWKAAILAGETTVAQSNSGNYWDSAWFIIDLSVAKKYIRFVEAKGYYYFDTEINKKNESLIEYAYDAYAYGVLSWLGVAGSKGDNSTFSG